MHEQTHKHFQATRYTHMHKCTQGSGTALHEQDGGTALVNTSSSQLLLDFRNLAADRSAQLSLAVPPTIASPFTLPATFHVKRGDLLAQN